MKDRQIDAEIKKGIDARTKEFKEKVSKLAYERIKQKLAPATEPLKGYPYNEAAAELDESRNEALKALEDLVKRGGVDKADFQKAHDLYKANKLNDLRKHISSLDTDPGEAIVRAFSRRDSKTFNSMYPRAKAGDYFANIIADHGSKSEAVSKYTSFSTQNKNRKPSLNQNKLSSAEYQQAKKLKGFNKDDWKYNGDLYIRVTESVALAASNLDTVYSDISEAFMRIPKSVRGNDLVALKQNFDAMYNSLSNGGDWKPEVYNSLVKQMTAISKSAKSFNSKDDMSSMYEENVKKGDSVKIINAKKYDALSKPEVSGTVIGMIGSKVMVKVGSGQMNVDPKDLVKESVTEAKQAIVWKVKPPKGQKNIHPDSKWPGMKPGDIEKMNVDPKDLVKESVELDEMKLKNSDAAMKLEKEISDLEKGISKLTPLARKDDDANMQLFRAKNRLKQKQEKYKQLMKEEVKLGEASNEGTIRIIDLGKNKGFQVQSMTNGKFVNVGKPYKDLKSAEEFKHLSYFSQSMSPQARASRAARELLNKESVELDEATWMVTIDKGIYGGVKSDGQPILVKAISARDATTKAANKVKIDPMLVPAGGFNAKVNNKESVELGEKSVSVAQQKIMGMALAYKRGEMPDASDEVKKIARSMTTKELEDFAKTKHKGLPITKESVELDEQALKAGKGKTTIDIDFLDDGSLAKKAEKKFNINIKTTKNQGAIVSGEKKDIIAYLLSNDYGMDAEDVRELFPELQEDSTVTERLKVSNMTEIAMTLKQLAAKYKGDIAKAQQSGNTDSLKKAEKELIAWAMDNNEIGNAKEADVWLDNVVADKDQFDALLKFSKN